MIISDLNYLEIVSEASEVQGGSSYSVSQTAIANSGNLGNDGSFNLALGTGPAIATNTIIADFSIDFGFTPPGQED